jgi:16S rRNA (cytidine1402-2'-O)-methyltransferase
LREIGSRLESEMVVYVSDAGMPIISDPGQILVKYCQEQSIEYDVLAGASAVTTAYASSGFEEGKFIFWGFLPHKGKARGDEVRKILNSEYNTIIYEAPHRLLKLLGEITSLDETRELFLAKELTKKFQKYYRGDAKRLFEELQTSNIKGEWVVIVKAILPKQDKALHLNDILALNIPPKIKAKLLSKVSEKGVKEWYNGLT